MTSSQNGSPIHSFGLDLGFESTDSEGGPIYVSTGLEIEVIGWPRGWDVGGTGAAPGRWSSYEGTLSNALGPGERIDGFTIQTQSPPGIRAFGVQAEDLQWDRFMKVSPVADLYQYEGEFFAEFFRFLNYEGRTVGPLSVPKTISPTSWTLLIQSFADQAHLEGWIKSKETLARLRPHIAALGTREIEELRKAVKRVSHLVLAEQEAGNLTGEADALIRLNAEYLLRRMTEERGSEGTSPE